VSDMERFNPGAFGLRHRATVLHWSALTSALERSKSRLTRRVAPL